MTYTCCVTTSVTVDAPGLAAQAPDAHEELPVSSLPARQPNAPGQPTPTKSTVSSDVSPHVEIVSTPPSGTPPVTMGDEELPVGSVASAAPPRRSTKWRRGPGGRASMEPMLHEAVAAMATSLPTLADDSTPEAPLRPLRSVVLGTLSAPPHAGSSPSPPGGGDTAVVAEATRDAATRVAAAEALAAPRTVALADGVTA